MEQNTTVNEMCGVQNKDPFDSDTRSEQHSAQLNWLKKKSELFY